jgi:hypothetical protein
MNEVPNHIIAACEARGASYDDFPLAFKSAVDYYVERSIILDSDKWDMVISAWNVDHPPITESDIVMLTHEFESSDFVLVPDENYELIGLCRDYCSQFAMQIPTLSRQLRSCVVDAYPLTTLLKRYKTLHALTIA